MNHRKQSPSLSFAELDSGRVFRAQVIGTIPATAIVMPRPFVGAFGRSKAIRTPHWLSGFVTSPDHRRRPGS
jgi:hypothetical protein